LRGEFDASIDVVLIEENITRHLVGVSLIAPSGLPINHVIWASTDNDIVQITSRYISLTHLHTHMVVDNF
jgi:hypothetical protein